MAKKIPDIPVALIALHPRVVYLPQAARGMFWSLIFYHWITGKPIPQTDQGVLAIILAHQPTWRAHKEEIRAILADVIPQLDRQREIKREARARLQMAADLSKASRMSTLRERHRREALEKSARAIAIPERTQTQTRINVERRTKRQSQNTFVEKYF
jgi:uncharacterized protein YdaU (DUF1376 family)